MATNAPPTTGGLRPTAHFTAASTWLNDPNGLLYHRGTYHLFFQTNPFGSTWGNMSWGHATSTDLVTWTEQPIAIACTDEEDVFSGSAVVDERNTAGFAREGQTALVAIYTSARRPTATSPAGQAQSLAHSLDGMTWTRYAGNPVLDIGSNEFRDPKVFWYGGQDGHWVMVAVKAVERRVAVYTSPDLITWTFASHFGPAHAVGGVWECPDLFPLTVDGEDAERWVMVVSLNPGGVAGGSGTQYFVGDFDGTRFRPERLSTSADPMDYDWLDYGSDYYAAVSFGNVPDGRRLMVGWASNWEYAMHTPTAPWRSAMSLVREVRLVRGEDGRLRLAQRPVLPPDGLTVARLTVTFRALERVEVRVGRPADASEGLYVTLDGPSRRISCDRRRSGRIDFHPRFASVDWAPLPAGTGDEVDLLVVADATVVEVYVGDGTVTFTEQVFPDEPYTTVAVVCRDGVPPPEGSASDAVGR